MNTTNKSSNELLINEIIELINELRPTLKKLSIGALKRLRGVIIEAKLEDELGEVLQEIELLLEELEKEIENNNPFSMRP